MLFVTHLVDTIQQVHLWPGSNDTVFDGVSGHTGKHIAKTCSSNCSQTISPMLSCGKYKWEISDSTFRWITL